MTVESWEKIDLYFLKTEPEKKTLGTYLRRMRYTYAMSQKDFAAYLNIPLNSYSMYENDKVSPVFNVMTKIANTLQISLDYFSGNSGYGYYKTYAIGLFAKNPEMEKKFIKEMKKRIQKEMKGIEK